MPFISKIGGGSARKFGLTRRSTFFTCNTHTAVVTLNNTDRRCYYPANYAATASNYSYSCQQGPGCYSGGGTWGTEPNAGCCYCNACPFANCVGCFGTGCNCYNSGWQFLGNGSGGCYNPYYITTTCTGTNYSCPTNTGVATLSGTTCVYPASYNATANG